VPTAADRVWNPGAAKARRGTLIPPGRRPGGDDELSIGARIRSLRGKFLTQQQLADTAQVSVDLIRKLEQGRRHTASIGSLHRIARALDVDLSVLLAKPTSMPSDDPNSGVVAIRDALTAVDDLLGEVTGPDEPTTVENARLRARSARGAGIGQNRSTPLGPRLGT
jgi:transcriptional regulator with XRE-family HTH domain